MSDTAREPSLSELGKRLQALQARAFEIYEDAAIRSESAPHHRDAIYAQAEAETAPLLAEAEALRERMIVAARRRARRARLGAGIGVAMIVVLLAWEWLRR